MDCAPPPTNDGERLIAVLRQMEAGYLAGAMPLHPHDIPPLLACQAAEVVPELIVLDEREPCGWSIHVPGGVVVHDPKWWDRAFDLFGFEDWLFYLAMRDAMREIDDAWETGYASDDREQPADDV